MSEAEKDVQAVVDHITGLAHGAITPEALSLAMLPGFTRLIAERLDSVVSELEAISAAIRGNR